MDQDFADTFREYLISMSSPIPGNEGKPHRWVMNWDWFSELRYLIDKRGYPFLPFPPKIDDPIYLLGHPIDIQEGAGAPTLEPKEDG